MTMPKDMRTLVKKYLLEVQEPLDKNKNNARVVFMKRMSSGLVTPASDKWTENSRGINRRTAELIAASMQVDIRSDWHIDDPETFDEAVRAWIIYIHNLHASLRQEFLYPNDMLLLMAQNLRFECQY